MKTRMVAVTLLVVASITAFADGSPELFHKFHLGMTQRQLGTALKRAPESCTPNGNGTVTCFFTGGENAAASV